MALEHLLTAEMTALTAALLDPTQHRPALEATPLLAWLVPELDSVHGRLCAHGATVGHDVASGILDALQQQSREVDRTHDRKGGGVQPVLDGLARLADREEDVARVMAVREALFPDGGAVFSMSYLAEAGDADRVERVLAREEVRAFLVTVAVRSGVTLYDEAREFVRAGRRLGVLESRKAAVAAAARPTSERVRAVAAARESWLEVVDLLLRAARRLEGTQAAAWAPIAREFACAEEAADARVVRMSTPGRPANDAAAGASRDEQATEFDPVESAPPARRVAVG